MAESVAAQTVISYLKDVDEKTQSAVNKTDLARRIRALEAILKDGDLELARTEIVNANEEERSALEAQCAISEGSIHNLIAVCYYGFRDDSKFGKLYTDHITKAIDCFETAIRIEPNPRSYYMMGLSLARLGRVADAIQALETAKNSDDAEVAVEANKKLVQLRSEQQSVLPPQSPSPPQSSASPQTTAKTSGGCAGILAFFVFVAIAIAIFVH